MYSVIVILFAITSATMTSCGPTLIPKVNSTVGRGEEMTMGKGGIKDEKEGQVQEK